MSQAIRFGCSLWTRAPRFLPDRKRGAIPASDHNYDCNHGFGPAVTRFRRFALRGVGLDPMAIPCPVAPVAAGARGAGAGESGAGAAARGYAGYKVLMSVRKAGSRFKAKGVRQWGNFIRRLDRELRADARLGPRLGAHAAAVDFAALPDARGELRALASSVVFITFCGGSSHIGWFLPRGATVILFCDRDLGRGSRRDGQMWSHLSHVRDVWLDLDDINSDIAGMYADIKGAVVDSLLNFEQFRDQEEHLWSCEAA